MHKFNYPIVYQRMELFFNVMASLTKHSLMFNTYSQHLHIFLFTLGGHSAHLAYKVHKSGRKTPIIIISFCCCFPIPTFISAYFNRLVVL